MELAETHADGLGQTWSVYLAALCHGLDVNILRRVGARLALSPRIIQGLIDGLTAAEGACHQLRTGEHLRPSEVVTALQRLPSEMLPLLLALCPEDKVHQCIQHYLTTWRHVRSDLTGHDLKRLGVSQGPQIGRLLAHVLAAKLDGEATSREAQEALVHSVVRQM
jgi:tRNA nucleotidyltransferase (CCA-adding enzyme)